MPEAFQGRIECDIGNCRPDSDALLAERVRDVPIILRDDIGPATWPRNGGRTEMRARD